MTDAADFRDAVLRVCNLGEDSDTTTVCGQFAETYWGKKNIPQKLLDGSARKDMIEAELFAMGVSKEIDET